MKNKNVTNLQLVTDAEIECIELFKQIDDISFFNQYKVLNAFRKYRVSTRHFAPTTGYGYDDVGRDTLAKIYSEVFGTEKAIVSPLITSGTQALTIALFGLLTINQRLLCITGPPYDTLKKVILGENIGSLKDYAIDYDEIDLKSDGKFDLEKIKSYLIVSKPNVVMITRSGGYSWREALSINDIKLACQLIKSISPSALVMVDNCYGEFVDKLEPSEVGADIIVGSLIKNPGGGIAPTGGYIAGKSILIDRISARFMSPALGLEAGSYYSSYIPFYQGFFLAPSVVSNALKGSILAGKCFSKLDFEVKPNPTFRPNDLIRAIKFNDKNKLISFIQSIQYSSPVDSHVTPYPWDMPGYEDPVIMAAGNFIQGSSIELSADSPIREPYIAYLQGGLTYEHFKIALLESLSKIFSTN